MRLSIMGKCPLLPTVNYQSLSKSPAYNNVRLY
jgi:hypothetical protein